jgi:hypothetical protein
MKRRTMVLAAAVLTAALGVGVGAWRYARRASPTVLSKPQKPPKEEASDQAVVDYAMAELRVASRDAVLQCGTAVARHELDAKVRVGTLAEGIEVLGFELVRSTLDAEQGACVAKSFVGKRGKRVGFFKDRIPEGREYELEAHLALPLATSDYGR